MTPKAYSITTNSYIRAHSPAGHVALWSEKGQSRAWRRIHLGCGPRGRAGHGSYSLISSTFTPSPLSFFSSHDCSLNLCDFVFVMAFNSKFIFQAYVVPWARKLSEKEQSEVNHYRHLRERFHEGPYYSVLDTSSSSAKKGSAARANFDPFHGMPSYSGRYQKKRRTLPKIANIGREYGKCLELLTLVSIPTKV